MVVPDFRRVSEEDPKIQHGRYDGLIQTPPTFYGHRRCHLDVFDLSALPCEATQSLTLQTIIACMEVCLGSMKNNRKAPCSFFVLKYKH